MYTRGNIIYFDPFYFPNGNTCKSKYFIILHAEDETVLIAGLPTSVDHVPAFITKKHGCISDNSINFNCYYFEKETIITDNGWGFPKDTHLYGDEINFFEKKRLDQIYKVEGVDYFVVGTMNEKEFSQMIECFKKSPVTKRIIRRKLGATI